MARNKEWKPGMRNRATGAVDYFLPYRLADVDDESARLMNHAVDKYDAVQQAMRERAGRRNTGISYTAPDGTTRQFQQGGRRVRRVEKNGQTYNEISFTDGKGGYRPAQSITINGKTFTGDDVYKARAAARQYAADHRKRSEFRDAMIGLANPNDPKGQRLIKAANAWFNSGKEITDRMRADFGNILKGRYAKIQEVASKMKPGDYLDFRKEQEKRVEAGEGPSDSPGTGEQGSPSGSSASRRPAGGPQDTGGGRSVVRPYTGNYATGIDRSEGRAREQAEHERIQYKWSGRGQRDYWQSKLLDTMQMKEANDAKRMHYDLLKLMATSRKYGINLDEGQVDTSGMSNGQAPAPAPAQKTTAVFGNESKFWRYRDKPDQGSYRMQGVV